MLLTKNLKTNYILTNWISDILDHWSASDQFF